jgi:hypothetical protein
LVAELNGDCLAAAVELKSRGCRFGEPGACPTFAVFSPTTNQFPTGGLLSTASFRLTINPHAVNLCQIAPLFPFRSSG